LALAEANQEYERRFGRVFIVCATGKSAPEMLEILRHRLRNDDAAEFREAAEEQRKITNIRLKKWLSK
jgi:2-oxo-4-hydroxy-4-carboxy-5-ureidoimidazoline decarboxylase